MVRAMKKINVHELDVPAVGKWSFAGSRLTWCHHSPVFEFDPFPAYPHNFTWVEDVAAELTRRCPPLWNVNLFVANREETGRTNGLSSIHTGKAYNPATDEWEDSDNLGLILLSGKRVPIHPSVTRYLVVHEYGHNVQWMMTQLSDSSKSVWDPSFLKEYAAMRGLPDSSLVDGAGGTWHLSAGEVFANDFRVLVWDEYVRGGSEHWPHPYPHPYEVFDLKGWWEWALATLREASTADAGETT